MWLGPGRWAQHTLTDFVLRLASRWSCLRHTQRVQLGLGGVRGRGAFSRRTDLSNNLLVELNSVVEGGRLFRAILLSFVVLRLLKWRIGRLEGEEEEARSTIFFSTRGNKLSANRHS